MVSESLARLGRSRQSTLYLAENRRLRVVKGGGDMWIYDPPSVDNFERWEKERKGEE